MDVFEHLVDPLQTVEEIWSALKPGGFLFGRFASDSDDDDHPQHIVHDFTPTMRRMQTLGFVEVWRTNGYGAIRRFRRPDEQRVFLRQ
jgi:hypothetical protein